MRRFRQDTFAVMAEQRARLKTFLDVQALSEDVLEIIGNIWDDDGEVESPVDSSDDDNDAGTEEIADDNFCNDELPVDASPDSQRPQTAEVGTPDVEQGAVEVPSVEVLPDSNSDSRSDVSTVAAEDTNVREREPRGPVAGINDAEPAVTVAEGQGVQGHAGGVGAGHAGVAHAGVAPAGVGRAGPGRGGGRGHGGRGRGRGRGRGNATAAVIHEEVLTWSDLDSPQHVQPFSGGPSGPNIVDLPGDGAELTPLYFFTLIWNFAWPLLVAETNRYAGQSGAADWVPTSVPEMKAFVGMLIAMGIVRLPCVYDYWSNTEMLHNSFIARTMPVNKFLKILRYFHLSDNTTHQPNDRLAKVSDFVTMLNSAFQRCWVLDRNISVDETLIPCKGRSFLKQYIKNKPHKWGIKLWVLACSATGYVWRFSVYAGKQQDAPEHRLSYRVVMDLVKGLYHRNHCIFMDNFYSGVELFVDLLSRGVYAVGTVRRNRKHLPPSVIDAAEIKKLKRGESIFRRFYALLCTTWKDTRDVTLLSTCHQANGTETVRRNTVTNGQHAVIDVPVPPCIADYNRAMGGVDLADQNSTYYTVKRKTRKWWKVIFARCLDMAIVNTWVMSHHSPGAPKLSQKQFRILLAEQLVGNFTNRKVMGVPTVEARLMGKHFLQKGKSQKCAVCVRTYKRRGLKRASDSVYWCHYCDPPVPLCMHPCAMI